MNSGSRVIIGIVSLLMLGVSHGHAKVRVLGSVGMTYPIVERDFVEEMKERAASVDWSKIFNVDEIEKKARKWRPESFAKLPKAQQDRRRLVDVSYTLEEDIALPDGSGIYPRGMKINPFDYMPMRETFVIFDGDDKDQVRWFKSRFTNAPGLIVMITGGDIFSLERELKRPLYLSDYRLTERLGVEVVPSVVRQSGKDVEVIESRVVPMRVKRSLAKGAQKFGGESK